MQQPSQATIAENDMNAYISRVINTPPASDPKLQEIQEAQDQDEKCKRFKTYCLEQWPDKQQVAKRLETILASTRRTDHRYRITPKRNTISNPT